MGRPGLFLKRPDDRLCTRDVRDDADIGRVTGDQHADLPPFGARAVEKLELVLRKIGDEAPGVDVVLLNELALTRGRGPEVACDGSDPGAHLKAGGGE